MSIEKLKNVMGIIERAKLSLGIKTDTELANLLNINQSTIAGWKKRGSIDIIAIINLCHNVSTDWLIYGKGSPEDSFDPITKKIVLMLEEMNEDQKRDILKHIEKEKLLEELLKKRKENAA